MTSIANHKTDDLLEILRFWHRLEFFTPFDLSNRTEPSEKKKVLWLDGDNLDGQLAELLSFRPPDGMRISSAHLFAGVFPMSDLKKFAREIMPEAPATFEDDERGLAEGRSCFARFGVDVGAAFRINFADIEISTLPWAIGQSRQYGLEILRDSTYFDSLPRLKDQLRQISDRAADDTGPALGSATLRDVIRALEIWAGYDLPGHGLPIACIEINLADAKRTPTQNEEEDEEPTAETEIGILNSFYITDLEMAMARLAKGEDVGALLPYLSASMTGAPVDLYGPEGQRAILEGVAPRLSNRGRWMSPPHHAMSLMQQFAINKAIGLRNSSGIFSVNGPLGTGKTTLLRDIIADNLVARAEILSKLPNARDAFETGKCADRGGSKQNTGMLSILKPELCGFGMVVASSNNAAVENISLDLPKSSSIQDPPDFGYLKPVAYKIAAQKRDGGFAILSQKDTPWGLIASALGKKSNRRQLRERLFFSPDRSAANKNSYPVTPQSIWEWRKNYTGPGFREAAKEFRALSARVTAEIELAERFCTLALSLSGQTCDSYVSDFRIKQQEAEAQASRNRDALDRARETVQALERKRDELREDERLLDRQRPPWWSRLLGLPEARKHHQKVSKNAVLQQELQKEIARATAHVETDCARQQEADLVLQKATDELARARTDFETKKSEFRALKQEGFSLPETGLFDLDQESVQIEGLWHHDRIAKSRSELTCAALRLHEAWLAEVSQTGGGFGTNLVAISKFLNGEYEGDPAPVWESLFMVVPLVSTTFASFTRQFSGMAPGSIGWLFIDEAGQSVPQAAVGAIMRARRVIVIGDPLQIEPVFTLPTALIDALARLNSATSDGSRSPDRVSVQVLADQTNRFGARITKDADETIWIGSPLRVHRRCADPMFSLANEIAYQGKMVFGAEQRLPAEDVPPFLGESAWIHLGGRVVGKQTVPAQVGFMVELLHAACQRQGTLPDLYVISPFKEIASQLKDQLMRADWTGLKKRDLNTWVTRHVGTVHTFQGKEEQTVFMVLGADGDHAAAARWASSKPNLLNVALTRAKKRFYAVGDRDLWSEMAGFELVARTLPVISSQEALQRARVPDQSANGRTTQD
ncbi:DEAD/DEAH box helicase [Paenirhodobacter sp.]|uniref:DEAD/DEAH box helicase n=1 Tax=Paenirhodobacter sp. TaxID=1965326 RepID=UPI003B3F13DB